MFSWRKLQRSYFTKILDFVTVEINSDQIKSIHPFYNYVGRTYWV